jgi:hypothetical protein
MINLVKGVTKMNVNFEDHRNEEAKDAFVGMIACLGDGNIGALAFISEVLDKCIKEKDEMAALALTRAKAFDIVGTKLYLIWNDCCERDTDKAIRVLAENSKDDIMEHLTFDARCNVKKYD